MTDLTIAFLLGTLPIQLIGWGSALDGEKNDFGASFFASFFLSLRLPMVDALLLHSSLELT